MPVFYEHGHSILVSRGREFKLSVHNYRNGLHDHRRQRSVFQTVFAIAHSAQFSTLNLGTRMNSLMLFVTSTKSAALAWAAMRVSRGPIGAPSFESRAQMEKLWRPAKGPQPSSRESWFRKTKSHLLLGQ